MQIKLIGLLLLTTFYHFFKHSWYISTASIISKALDFSDASGIYLSDSANMQWALCYTFGVDHIGFHELRTFDFS